MIDLNNDKMIEMYKTMLRIRLFEEKLNALVAEARISGFVHLYLGEEAVATGVCATLRNSDYITSTHRGHGHLVAKGGDPKYMMAELAARSPGYCLGRGGSLHMADFDLGILGANGIVAGGIPIAVGSAQAFKMRGEAHIALAFFRFTREPMDRIVVCHD